MSVLVGVLGKGIVGHALGRALERRGHDVRYHDPPKGIRDPASLGAKVVFVCVPTPEASSPRDVFDDDALGDALSAVADRAHDGAHVDAVVIRSTVPPGTTESLQHRMPSLPLLHAPEFLTEASAFRDEESPARQIVGYTERSRGVADAVLEMLPWAPLRATCPATDAELVKYFANAFYATKVAFANQFFEASEALGGDWERVRGLVEADPMCAPHHLDVHHAGYRGFGGKCLPKDSRTLLRAAARAGVELSILGEAVRYNDELRLDAAADRPAQSA